MSKDITQYVPRRHATTTVDIVIRVEVEGNRADVANYRDALDCLADVMAVQAEDGLWSLGHEDAESDDGPSEIVANITSARVHAVLIDGVDDLTKDLVVDRSIEAP